VSPWSAPRKKEGKTVTDTKQTDTKHEQMLAMSSQLRMPYTLTPGQATGVFLAELAKRRLIGSRHAKEILLPAADFDGETGAPSEGFVEVGPVGEVVGFTSTGEQTLGLIRIDGTRSPFVHWLSGFGSGELSVGTRVQAIWAAEPSGKSILDLQGFGPLTNADSFEPRPVDDLAPAIEQIDYSMTLDYEHAYGHYYGTMFDGVKTDRRIRGIKCSKCARVLLPPRPQCDVCYAPTTEWVDVASTGTIQASSVVHIEFVGQRRTPPYVYAEIVLDGTSTRLIHTVGGVGAEEAKTAAAPGARVQAVWSDRHTGSLADIDHFEVL
jgi:uncharacterized OB-fold protein